VNPTTFFDDINKQDFNRAISTRLSFCQFADCCTNCLSGTFMATTCI
jgi:hypothetical protein